MRVEPTAIKGRLNYDYEKITAAVCCGALALSVFAGCNGSFLYDYEDKPYLDLQMWYSAVNFGYATRA